MEECRKRGDCFEEAIKKSQILNFATENFSKNNKFFQTLKIQQKKIAYDTIGRLQFLAVIKQIVTKRNLVSLLSQRWLVE